MRHVLARLVVAIAVVIPAVATADPVATLTVDGVTYDIPISRLDEKRFQFGEPSDDGRKGWNIEVPDVFSVFLTGVLDPDPSIAYALTVTDFGASTTFSFQFGTPIVPTGSPNVVAASLSGTLTDTTGNGVALTPVGSTVQTAAVNTSTNLGVDLGTAASHSGTTQPPLSYAYGPFGAGPIAGPGPGPWTSLFVHTVFTLSGDGDLASLAGSASINELSQPVPEPGLMALMAVGLGVMLGHRRRVH